MVRGTVPDSLDMDEVAARFAAAFGAHAPVPVLQLDLGLARVIGRPGIRRPMHYSNRSFNLLSGKHGYTFDINEREVEVSLQLYENVCGFHRLFAYARATSPATRRGGQVEGMVFSVNLTTGRQGDGLIHLRQQLKIVNRREGAQEQLKRWREQQRDDLVAELLHLGIVVADDNEVELGAFDPWRHAFVGTDADCFLRDFLTVALLKGHFMENKGYSLV